MDDREKWIRKDGVVRRIRPEIMFELRKALGPEPGSRRHVRTETSVARLFGKHVRSVYRWETEGASVVYGYAYVGLAFRIGGAPLAHEALAVLARVTVTEVPE